MSIPLSQLIREAISSSVTEINTPVSSTKHTNTVRPVAGFSSLSHSSVFSLKGIVGTSLRARGGEEDYPQLSQ